MKGTKDKTECAKKTKQNVWETVCGKSANTGIFPGSFLKMLLEVEGSILRMFCVNVAVI